MNEKDKYYEFDFPTLFTICNHVLKMSMITGIDLEKLNDCKIRVPLHQTKEFYYDISIPELTP